jgi:hypothetical protein
MSVFSSCEQDFIMKETDSNQVDGIVHQTMQLRSTTVIYFKPTGRQRAKHIDISIDY